jgi:predicted metal-dependent HD superfamily phosphohydrolase
LDILQNNLSSELYYHGIHHTLDALRTSKVYLRHVDIGPHESKLLRLGILLHDIGFIESTIDHELRGARIAEKLLREYDFPSEDIQIIKGLIMATRIPQEPKTFLEKIICDVDLDYLGRPDFYEISETLFQELKVYTSIRDRNEWNKLQVGFLEAHRYHTEFAIKNRQPKKEQRIKELKEMIT